MKKIVNLLLVMMVALAAGSCGRNDAALKAQIESGNKHCPMSLGQAGKITKMTYDESDRMVDFVITVNKKFVDIEDLRADEESSKEAIRLAFSQGDLNKLLKMMADADAGLKVTYKDRVTKEDFEIDFSAEEMKKILDNPMTKEETNRLLLANQVKSEKKKLPYNIEKGLKVVNIEDAGSNLVYTCEVDENLYEIDEMTNAKDELKKNMRGMMRDPAMKKQAEILSSLNKGFEYKYVGQPSGKTVTVSFTAEELGEISGKRK